MTLLKINRLLSIHTSNVLLKFGLDIQSQTKVRVQKLKNPKWPLGGHFEIFSDITENRQTLAHGHKQNAYEIWHWNSKANSSYAPETMPPTESPCHLQSPGYRVQIKKIQYGCQVAILKVILQKINRLLPMHTTDVPVKFGLDIQSQTKVSLETKIIQYGCQAAILKVALLKINRLLPIATNNMHMKFEI